MGRSKATGVYKTARGHEVDRFWRGQRFRRCGFTSYEDAEAWLMEQIGRLQKAESTVSRAIRTFSKAAAAYLDKQADKPSTVSDMYHLKAVMPFIGAFPLHQVHDGTLEDFVKARQAAGRKTKTINLSLAMVRRILNLAAHSWRDEKGAIWLAEPPMITMLTMDDQREPRPIDWTEQEALLSWLPHHLADMARFVLNTGVRDEVVCNLQWEWEIPIPDPKASVLVVPANFVKGQRGKKKSKYWSAIR